jgi:putative transposase
MPNYRRNLLPGGSFFFTVNLADRRSKLLTERVDLLRTALRYVRARRPFTVDAIVVLPDHVHTIWTLPPGDADFATRWRLIKTLFSRSVEDTELLSPSRQAKGERGIWQRRFYEHVLRDDEDYANHVDYAHFNPVKHGHVGRPIDWPFSSLHRYIREGILPADWGTDGNVVDLNLG